jgi:hypothetical protein
MSKIIMPEFSTKQDAHKWLFENHDKIISQKKASTKEADNVFCNNLFIEKTITEKAVSSTDEANSNFITRKCVINTTNYLDSHKDVHIPGIWKKSLKETKSFSLIKEHKFNFDNEITDDVKAFTELINWKELGLKIDGQSEALVFLANIPKTDQTGMYQRYLKNTVKNHSVGMQYVKIYFCMDNEDAEYAQFKDNWDKYISQVVNVKDAEETGYFWAITEAKIIEGSAVLRGSNPITPTLNQKEEPNEITPNEPNEITQEKEFDLKKAINETNFITKLN